MDEQNTASQRQGNPRRRKRTKWEMFKEAYLPVVIAGAAVLLILIFIIGSIVRNVERGNAERDASIAASMEEAEKQLQLQNEAEHLLQEAATRAAMTDYDTAIATIDSFTGNIADFPALVQARRDYEDAKANLVAWDNPDDVLNLSFNQLIVDATRAFPDATYGTSYQSNFITTEEFAAILQQLYSNNYMLVRLSDFFTTGVAEDGSTVYLTKTVYLPAGKKPLILTQANLYFSYMVDSNDDEVPDKDGDGFATKLVVAPDGSLSNEYIDKDGNTLTGNYDLVPILETFIATHPDFSYRGARAILAVSGYDGLFGYRTYPGADSIFGAEYLATEKQEATRLIAVLKDKGYELASYTYINESYDDYGTAEIKEDLEKWNNEVTPILGDTQILVLPKGEDIEQADIAYSGEKYQALVQAGFRYFIGFCDSATSWSVVSTDHVRMGRLMVTGNNLQNHADWFTGIFDATSVLDENRN